MSLFRDYLNNLLLEMPYIEIGNQITDIELEKIKTKEQFGTFLKFFFSLSNKTPKDKYGERIAFTSKKDRDKIKTAIVNNPDVQNFLPSIKMSSKELQTFLKDL